MPAKAVKETEQLLADIRKKHGEGALMQFSGKVEPVPVIPSGCLSVDVALGVGGYPRGRIIEAFGAESSGKTTLALHAIAETQKLGELAAFVDAEHALDVKYAQALGVNVDQLLVSQPDSGEQALSIVEDLVKSDKVSIIVVDSVAALTPRAELEGEMGDSHMGLHARLMSQAMRKLVAAVGRSGCLVFFINQERQKIGVMFGPKTTTTGGNALRFYSSVRLDVSKREQVKEGDDHPIGNRTVIKVVKNKVAPPFAEADVEIRWGHGIDRAADVLSCAVAHKLVEKHGSWFSYQGEKIAQGFVNASKHLGANPVLLDKLDAELRKALLP